MPNRIIKESICRSDNLDRLTSDEECFFYRLMVQCDDYGRYDGRAAIIKGACFPLKQHITPNKVDKMLVSLVRELLVFVYVIDGLPYIQMAKWDKHQQIRAKRSKYPDPNGHSEIVQSSDINGNQPHTDDGKCPRNPIQSNPNPIRNPIQSVALFESKTTPLEIVLKRLNELREKNWTWAQYTPLTSKSKTNTEHITALLNDGQTAEQLIVVLEYIAAKNKGHEPSKQFFNCVTPFRPKNWENNLAMAADWDAKGRPDAKPSDNGNGRRVVTRPGEYDDVFEEA